MLTFQFSSSQSRVKWWRLRRGMLCNSAIMIFLSCSGGLFRSKLVIWPFSKMMFEGARSELSHNRNSWLITDAGCLYNILISTGRARNSSITVVDRSSLSILSPVNSKFCFTVITPSSNCRKKFNKRYFLLYSVVLDF
jgi:hypothetical protein